MLHTYHHFCINHKEKTEEYNGAQEEWTINPAQSDVEIVGEIRF